MALDGEGKLKPADVGECRDVLSASAVYFVSEKLALLVWPGNLVMVVPRADVLTNFARCGVSCNVMLNLDVDKIGKVDEELSDDKIAPHDYHDLMLHSSMTTMNFGGNSISSMGTPCSEAMFKLACCVYAVKDEECEGCLPNRKGTGIARDQIVKNMLSADAPKKVKQSTSDAKFFDKDLWDGDLKEYCMIYAMISKLGSVSSCCGSALGYLEGIVHYLLLYFGVPATHVNFCECKPDNAKFVDKEWGCGLSVDDLVSYVCCFDLCLVLLGLSHTCFAICAGLCLEHPDL